MKNKQVTAALALTLGMYGVHRFYLGQRLRGVVHFCLAIFAGILLIEEGAPLILLPAIIGFMDAVLFLVMPQEEFDERYNFRKNIEKNWDKKRQKEVTRYEEDQHLGRQDRRINQSDFDDLYQSRTTTSADQPFKRTGVAKFNRYDYKGAIKDFQRALRDAPNDAGLHFNMACCYSIEEETMMSLYHLDKAIENGYDKFNKIHRHTALAFVRQQPQFQQFVNNDYQLTQHFEEVEEALDESPEGLELDSLIDQIKKLGELRAKGILTDEEFEEQKRRLL